MDDNVDNKRDVNKYLNQWTSIWVNDFNTELIRISSMKIGK